MKNLLLVLTLGLVLGTCAVLRAAGLEVPPGDPLQSLLALIMNWKASTPIVIGIGLISVIVQSLKAFLPSSAVRKAVVVALGVAYALLQAVIGGIGWMEAAVMILLTSGGAVALYEWVIKPLLGKKEPA